MDLDQFVGKMFGIDVSFDDVRKVTGCNIVSVVPPKVFVTGSYIPNRACVFLRTGSGRVGEIDRVVIG